MNLLDKEGMEFYRQELLDQTRKTLELFEWSEGGAMEMGRIRLYEEKMTIEGFFDGCQPEPGLLLANHPAQGILGRQQGSFGAKSLAWLEQEGLRYSMITADLPNVSWECYDTRGRVPNVGLTEEARVVKKQGL